MGIKIREDDLTGKLEKIPGVIEQAFPTTSGEKGRPLTYVILEGDSRNHIIWNVGASIERGRKVNLYYTEYNKDNLHAIELLDERGNPSLTFSPIDYLLDFNP